MRAFSVVRLALSFRIPAAVSISSGGNKIHACCSRHVQRHQPTARCIQVIYDWIPEQILLRYRPGYRTFFFFCIFFDVIYGTQIGEGIFEGCYLEIKISFPVVALIIVMEIKGRDRSLSRTLLCLECIWIYGVRLGI